MFRLFFGCVMVAAVCVTAVMLLAPAIGDDNPPPNPEVPPLSKGGPDVPRAGTPVDDDKPADLRKSVKAAMHQPMTILDARVLPVLRQDVPSERDGKLIFLATEVRPGEHVPAHKELYFSVATLGVPVTGWEGVLPEERIVEEGTGNMYRQVRPSDYATPGKALIVRHRVRFRTLDIGDKVKEGQTLGLINPVLAIEDLAIKLAMAEAAQSDVYVSRDMKTESKRRYDAIVAARRSVKSSFSLDDEMIAQVTFSRYTNEEEAKKAAVKKGQRELSAAQTTLRMHQLKANISGVIRAVYKQPGEAVRNLEAVLQLQSPDVLRVEAQVEVQDALELRKRMQRAEAWRVEAQRIRLQAIERGDMKEPPAAAMLMRRADSEVRVEVEASRQEPPLAALSGHTQEVTCVAMTAEAEPRVVSGSEDHTVRVWKKATGEDRWGEEMQLDHRAVVRSLAVTGPKAKTALLLTGTATGRARLFGLADMKETMLDSRHTGAINAVAFSADGDLCVTGGEDASLCLWKTDSGKLLGRVANAHRAAVTSAVFTPKGRVVTAGRDKRIVVWRLAEGGEGGRTLERDGTPLDRRGGEVGVLGTDPEGTYVLFDDGREVSIRSLDGRQVAGTLRNPPGAPNFAGFALYSPDGKTILAAGNGPGRLQLWRAPGEGVRPAELRQYLWSGNITCGAFAPGGKLAATGTADNRVLVWQLPESVEVEKPLDGQLTFVEEFLDTSLRKLTIRATVDNRGGWVIPGATATVVVPPVK